MHPWHPGIYKLCRGLESPHSSAKGVDLVAGQGPGGGWRGRDTGLVGPSGSDLRNSRPHWPYKAILNCYNYRVSLGQWHHGVWASFNSSRGHAGAGLGGEAALWGKGDPSQARGGAWKAGSGRWKST